MTYKRYLDLRNLISGNILGLEKSSELRKMVHHSYQDQDNVQIYGDMENEAIFFDEAVNPKTEDSYAFRCLIAKPKSDEEITSQEMGEFLQEWVGKAERIWQFRGDSRTGFQVQQLIRAAEGNLYPSEVYELQEDLMVKKMTRTGPKSMRKTTAMTFDEFMQYISEQLDAVLETGKGQAIRNNTSISMESVVAGAIKNPYITSQEVARADSVERNEREDIGEKGGASVGD